MDTSAFKSPARGRVRQTLEGYEAFFPERLPRSLEYSAETVHKLNDAVAAVHRLGGASRLLPSPDLLSRPYIQVEAVLSSRIEGTQTTVHELLRFEADESAADVDGRDVREVANYSKALDVGFRRLKELPLSLRLLREMHATLFTGVAGAQTPGEFRTSQNWIGPPGCTLSTATFVPPPPDHMAEALTDFERFLHERERPALITLAMAHYQFEVIHPFLDGNGRIGRLLVPLVLAERGVLAWPLLPLSVYLEQHRTRYYELLFETSATGDFTAWFNFFLDGVRDQAIAAEERAARLVDLQKELRDRLLDARASNTCLRLADHLLSNPIVTGKRAQQVLGVSRPTAHATIDRLEELGILSEMTQRSRNRVYIAQEIFDAVYDLPQSSGAR
jgi:Fic family protein